MNILISRSYAQIVCTIIFLLVIAVSSLAQTPERLDELIHSYHTQPRSHAKEESVLSFVQKHPSAYTDVLDQLKQHSTPLPPAFLLDSARMIIFSQRASSELTLAAELLSQTPFSLIDTSEWLYLCQKIGQQGGSIMPCAERILREKPSSFTSISVLGAPFTLGRDYAFLFVLLSAPETQWNQTLADRLWLAQDSVDNQLVLANALFYAVSLRNDVILSKIANDYRFAPPVRSKVAFYLQQMHDNETFFNTPQQLTNLTQHVMHISWPQSELQLRAQRRKALQQLSVSALQQLERYTFLIRGLAAQRWDKEAKQRQSQSH